MGDPLQHQRVDQYTTAELTADYRQRYQNKPVILDEICYEGNIEHGWEISAGENWFAASGKQRAAAAMQPMERPTSI